MAVPKSPRVNDYQNVNATRVERKNSNSRDIKRHPVERSSSSGNKTRKHRVRRNKSDADNRAKRKEERRYLTIGYPGEVRSPLKERQNIPASVRRSESDRTGMNTPKSGDIITRSRLQELENIQDYENVMAANVTTVTRKHSLKCDMMMSPRPKPPSTPARHVKRAASERATPKTAPYNRYGPIK